MTRTQLGLSFGFAVALFAAHNVNAQTVPQGGAQCGDREKVVSHLVATYGETRQGMGIAANNTVMEVFASSSTGTWTITVTLPTGVTCLVASGQGYEALAETLPAKGEDA